MTDIQTLNASLAKLGPKDQEFAISLIAQSKTRTLSDKQRYWVDKLIERASKPAPQAVQVGDMSGAIALFDKAAQKLKCPAVVLDVAGVGEIRINVAGQNAQVPGSLSVVRETDRAWLGRITREGVFEPSRKHDTPEGLIAGLVRFSEDPAGVAAEHGRLCGKCCFCNTGLTDERSTAAGYGPICAKNYGLYEQWKIAAKQAEH